MSGILIAIVIFIGLTPRVAPDRMSTFTFSGGYTNRTGSNVPSGSIALKTSLVVNLTHSLEAGLEGGFYNIEQEDYPGGEEYPLKKVLFMQGLSDDISFPVPD